MTAEPGKSSPVRSAGVPLRVLAGIGIILFIALPELRIGSYLSPGGDFTSSLIHEAVFWGIALLLLGYVLVIERQSLASIGLKRPTWKTLAFGLLGGFALLAAFTLTYTVIFPLLDLTINQEGISSITSNPLWFQAALFVRAAVVEEIIYRGYLIERVEMLTRSRWAAFAVSVAAFTVVHLTFWGAAHLIAVGMGAVILAALYLWRRDLVTNMVAHFVADTVGFLLAATSPQA